ncbi:MULTISPECIES: DUF930 domain-containing protein [unclassified Rhizobium]|uniref:DUF930 domain-containing protein n=1 Tax=unclassified Rhizobium TaxID=2613769 RepID=UPI001AD9BC25|nr:MULTISPECIES: DUF930 domain-containing protein [unclassified Rhizobium]MBO9125712.1 DUF930 domain-containing protein [Rhizobium sp. 16-488-2b]MBO9176296.1 DUF930 domain-containing protein [Rhizobium sp. 16-488-2a]
MAKLLPPMGLGLLKTGLALFAICALSTDALALDGRTIAQIKKLTPVDQLDQRCDIEAMDRLQADKVISYTFSHPKRTAVHVDADGAVFRRNGNWYRLSYACTTSPDHLSIVAFSFKRGAIIAHKDWTRYYLYP